MSELGVIRVNLIRLRAHAGELGLLLIPDCSLDRLANNWRPVFMSERIDKNVNCRIIVT